MQDTGSGTFLVIETVTATQARILETASVLDTDVYAAMLDARGASYILVPFDGNRAYVELSTTGGMYTFKGRDPFSGAWSKTSMLPLEVAVLTKVPKTKVSVVGPFGPLRQMMTQTIAHPGGDLKLSFAVPGQYTVSFEAFPMRAYSGVLTVKNLV